MILVFDDKHKNDLSFLKRISPQILNEFCKIALQFIKQGVGKINTNNLYSSAAQKLGVSPDVIQHCVEGLIHLFSESAHHQLGEVDFLDSLLFLEFSTDQNEVLKQYYIENSKEIRELISNLSFSLPRYTDLNWRLDIEMSKRTLHNHVTPEFTLRLDTADSNGESHSDFLSCDYSNMRHLCSELETALKEIQSGHCRRIMRNIK